MNKSEIYIIVQWPESQYFLDRDDVHLINDDNGINIYGSSAYFVSIDTYEKISGTKITIEL